MSKKWKTNKQRVHKKNKKTKTKRRRDVGGAIFSSTPTTKNIVEYLLTKEPQTPYSVTLIKIIPGKMINGTDKKRVSFNITKYENGSGNATIGDFSVTWMYRGDKVFIKNDRSNEGYANYEVVYDNEGSLFNDVKEYLKEIEDKKKQEKIQIEEEKKQKQLDLQQAKQEKIARKIQEKQDEMVKQQNEKMEQQQIVMQTYLDTYQVFKVELKEIFNSSFYKKKYGIQDKNEEKMQKQQSKYYTKDRLCKMKAYLPSIPYEDLDTKEKIQVFITNMLVEVDKTNCEGGEITDFELEEIRNELLALKNFYKEKLYNKLNTGIIDDIIKMVPPDTSVFTVENEETTIKSSMFSKSWYEKYQTYLNSDMETLSNHISKSSDKMPDIDPNAYEIPIPTKDVFDKDSKEKFDYFLRCLAYASYHGKNVDDDIVKMIRTGETPLGEPTKEEVSKYGFLSDSSTHKVKLLFITKPYNEDRTNLGSYIGCIFLTESGMQVMSKSYLIPMDEDSNGVNVIVGKTDFYDTLFKQLLKYDILDSDITFKDNDDKFVFDGYTETNVNGERKYTRNDKLKNEPIPNLFQTDVSKIDYVNPELSGQDTLPTDGLKEYNQEEVTDSSEQKLENATQESPDQVILQTTGLQQQVGQKLGDQINKVNLSDHANSFFNFGKNLVNGVKGNMSSMTKTFIEKRNQIVLEKTEVLLQQILKSLENMQIQQ